MANIREVDLGIFTAYGLAREAGYEGTKEEFAEGLRESAEYSGNAEASAIKAADSARDASTSSTNAAGSASAASSSAASASSSASSASNSAAAASESAGAASRSAGSATGSANAAATSASEAAGSASSASGSASTATASANTASARALDSEAYAIGKRNSVDVDQSDVAYHNNAKYYAEQASGSATAAQTAAGNAASSASAASASATAAGTAQGVAEEAAKTAEEVLESIPADYSELSQEVTDLKQDLLIINNGQTSITLNIRESDFYKGYYNASYVGQNITSGISQSGWGIVVLKFPAESVGKQLVVSGANGQGGANSAWLNSSDPNDTVGSGWQTAINNGSHLIKSEYLALCMYAMGQYIGATHVAIDNISEIKAEISTISTNLDNVFNTQYVKKSETETGKYWVQNGSTISKSSNAGYKAVSAISCKAGTYTFNSINANLTYIRNLSDFSIASLSNIAGITGQVTTPKTYTFGYNYEVYITANISLENPMWCDGEVPSIYTEGYYLVDGSTVTVAKDGTGDFTTLKEAIEYANKGSGITINVMRGTYDLIEEFGDEYFNSFTSSTSESAGLSLGYGTKIVFASDSKVIANYTGANEYVPKKFSPFNKKYNSGGFTLENLTLECSNCRYAIHDEDASNADIYHNVYKNCNIKIDNSSNTQWGAKQCIGGGLGQCGYIEIDGCTFDSVLAEGTQNYGVVSYHNASNATAKSNIIVKNSYFGKGQTVRASYYGTSEKITTVSVTGCGLGSAPIVTAETSGSTTVNVEIKSYANEIRNDSYVA